MGTMRAPVGTTSVCSIPVVGPKWLAGWAHPVTGYSSKTVQCGILIKKITIISLKIKFK